MNRVFVDASYWIALRDNGEAWHARAREIAASFNSNRRALIASNLVLAEIHAFFSRRLPFANQIIQDFSGKIVSLEYAGRSDHDAALVLLANAADKTYSYCDAVSFVMMRRLGLKEAASFDHHFRQIGEFEIIS